MSIYLKSFFLILLMVSSVVFGEDWNWFNIYLEDIERILEENRRTQQLHAEYAAKRIEDWRKITLQSINELRPGDVLQYRNSLSPNAWGTGGGSYSHSAIYIGNGNKAEMLLDGGKINTVGSLSQVDVFRNQNSIAAQNAARVAQETVTRFKYDSKGILTYVWGKFGYKPQEDRAICSEFVNNCLTEVGIPIVNRQKFLTSPDNPLRKPLVSPNYLGYALGEFGLARTSFQTRHSWQSYFSPQISSLGTGPIGGILLDVPTHLPLEGLEIRGLVFDEERGELILIGKNKTNLPSFNFDDLMVALQIAYGIRQILVCSQCNQRYFVNNPLEQYSCPKCTGSSLKREIPALSIDPIPENPNGPTMNVLYYGGVHETKIGFLAFECDRLLKGLTVGRDNVTKQEMISHVPGFQSILDKKLNKKNSSLWNRFWICPQKISLKYSPEEQSLVFMENSLKVKTETMRLEAGVLHSTNQRDEQSEDFATHFTKNYEAFAQEYPVFEELKETFKALGLAQALYTQKIPIDLSFLRNYQPKKFKTPLTTPSVSNQKSISGGIVSVFGGVDLNLEPEVIQGNNGLRDIIEATYPENKDTWEFEYGKQKLRAVSLQTYPKDLRLSFHLHPKKHQYYVVLKNQKIPYQKIILHEPFLGRRIVFTEIETLQNQLVYKSLDQEIPILVIAQNAYMALYQNGKRILFAQNGQPLLIQDTTGKEINYSYNEAGFPIKIQSKNETIEFLYKDGKIQKIAGKEASILYGYDERGQIQKVGLQFKERHLEIGKFKANHPSYLRIQEGSNWILYEYSEENLLKNVKNSKGYQVDFGYTSQKKLHTAVLTDPSGKKESFLLEDK